MRKIEWEINNTDLLGACKSMVAATDEKWTAGYRHLRGSTGLFEDAIKKIKAAIAKAEGREV